MAKRKDSMALFEAISRTKAKQGQVLPPHVGISPQPIKAESRTVLYTPPADASTNAADQTPAVPGAAVPPSAAAARAQAMAAAQQTLAPQVPELPVVQTSVPYSGTGHFVLTKVHIVGLAVVVVAVLVGVWYFVHPSQPVSNVAGNAVAAERVGAETALPIPVAPLFQAGKYYLVVESIKGDRKADAEAIADWLNKKHDAEIQAVVRQNSRSGNWEVLTTKAFTEVPYTILNGKVSCKVEPTRFAKKIEKLGDEYFAQFPGTYQFKQTRKSGNVTEFAPSYVKMTQDSN